MFQSEIVARYVEEKTGDRISIGDSWQTLREFAAIARDLETAPSLLGRLPTLETGEMAYNMADHEGLVGGVFNANLLSREIEKLFGDRAPLDILDFGCGASRILRYFPMFKPEHNYYAAEVNPACIRHVKEVVPSVQTTLLTSNPPSDLTDASIDVAYAWSIWTHFDEPTGRAWLEELHRVLRPGGAALITCHTDELVDRYGKEEPFVSRLQAAGEDYSEIRKEYDERGFAYWRSYPETSKNLGIDNESFGMTFMSVDYVRKNWSDIFSLADVVEGIPRWQDILVLQKVD